MDKKVSPNLLIHEKSPYLLQHAFNPVDWRPWGKEAQEKARAENKPIFLSIGYATCHWCHVMERESFSDPEIAKIINQGFVAIKLDREERPDIDKVYMTAVQALSGRGGWPLNVFLTPDLKPFYGGTYFPPAPQWGMQGFPQVLSRISELWTSEREGIESDAERIAASLKEMLESPGAPSGLAGNDDAILDDAFKAYSNSFDPERAGFGGAPKFPVPGNQNFLLRYFSRTQNEKAFEIARQTLTAMAAGGIYDHVGGGFHRYSTDADWRLPHFEKMLYDNAQLAINYLEAHQTRPNPFFLKTAQETLDYLLRDLSDPQGGFYCAEDADSLPVGQAEHPGEKGEGNFYLWTEPEIKKILGSESELFCRRYGVTAEGNLSGDPHGEFSGKNILYLADLDANLTAEKIADSKKKLLEARGQRPRPLRDEKILTSWNGLALSALAKGYEISGDIRYLQAAQKTAASLRDRLYDPSSKSLFHRWSSGERAIDAFSDDYAFLAQGLLDLYEASFETAWLEWALELSEKLLDDFAAPHGGFYLASKIAPGAALHPIIDDADSVEPCSSSIAALVFLRLSLILDRPALRNFAEKTLRRFTPLMKERPTSLSYMLSTLDFSLAKPFQIAVSGTLESPDGSALLAEIRRHFIPNRTLVSIAKNLQTPWSSAFGSLKASGEKPAVYVCRGLSCKNPENSVSELSKILSQKNKALD